MIRRRWTSLAVLSFAASSLLVLSTGCTDKRKRVKRVLNEKLKECRHADGTFAELELFGDTKRTVLRSTCKEKMGKIEMPDPFSARTTVGPYTWKAGLYEPKDLWVVKNITWKPFDTARRYLNIEDVGAEKLQRAAEKFGQAQKDYPKSSWIRLRRLEALLRAQRADMGSASASSFKLEDAAKKQYRQTVEWAKQKGDADTRVRARLMVVDHYRAYEQFYRDAKNALGSKDAWLKNSIEEAEKNDRPKRAEKYRKQLEKRRKKRPKKRKQYNAKIEAITSATCETLRALDPVGIEDKDLENRALSAKGSTSCDPAKTKSNETSRDGKTTDEGSAP
ncbi:MAG: hypothetical protein ABEL76_15955 [Bradymonadaceae bacterium]